MRSRPIKGESSTLQSSAPEEHISGDAPRSRCLTEDEILAFCAGEASKSKLAIYDEHLDQCEVCRACVAEMVGHEDRDRDDDEDDTLHPTIFQPGMIASDRFRIVRFVKRGGMGEVYEAFDQVLEVPVALKTVVSTACDSPRAVRKLKAEVQLARSVRHPNVCSVFDFWEHRTSGDDRGSMFFFTMEFIEGETLGQRLRRQRPSLPEVMRLARLSLLGLAAAHASGVVHRDYKSDNVMLRRGRSDDSEVVVMDFGLARTLHSDVGSASNDSQHLAGSVAYMAPEQVEGRRHIGTEADIFAFGVVLFEMLTGQLPFSGDSPWTTATRRLTERAPAPSRFVPHVTPALDAFVLRCMSREPEDRFRDAGEALAAFDRLSESRAAQRPSRVRRGAAAVAAAACVVTVALAWTRSPAPKSAEPGEVERESARTLDTAVKPLERDSVRSRAEEAPRPAEPARGPEPTPSEFARRSSPAVTSSASDTSTTRGASRAKKPASKPGSGARETATSSVPARANSPSSRTATAPREREGRTDTARDVPASAPDDVQKRRPPGAPEMLRGFE